ncbi:protein YneF [Enterobacter asburiae]|uniref:Protein YneF n=1 Tax=Enterobacter asburiae TaxID=61645 RepID=A0A376FB31_ENTAS|nr:protein YneF [Enterobacter asburiae]
MRSALTAFRPFQVDTPLRNAATIFILTTLFYFVGAELRLVEAPVAVLAAEWRHGRDIRPAMFT